MGHTPRSEARARFETKLATARATAMQAAEYADQLGYEGAADDLRAIGGHLRVIWAESTNDTARGRRMLRAGPTSSSALPGRRLDRADF
jgi:hypothetical protein